MTEIVAMFNRKKAECANVWTHAVSFALCIISSFFLIWKAYPLHSVMLNVTLWIFAAAELLLFAASTVYHLTFDEIWKRRWRYWDHISIYVVIAASYTPILLYKVGGTLGIWATVVIWAIALFGTFFKVFFLGRFPRFSLALYLVMGWIGVCIAKPVFENLPSASLWFLLVEGIAFSAGTYFFWKDDNHTYYHAIWHVFVYLGSFAHFLVLWFFL